MSQVNDFVKKKSLYVNKGRPEALFLYKHIKDIKNKKFPIYINGSGYYHHKTFDIVLEKDINRYIHIDAHPDDAYSDPECKMTYYSFIKHIQRLEKIKQILFLGLRYEPNEPINENYKKINTELDIPKKDNLKTHISIDLDVLKEFWVVEKIWQQDATMDLPSLLNYLEIFKERFNIGGVDICGISRSVQVMSYPDLKINSYHEIMNSIDSEGMSINDCMGLVEKIILSLP